MIRFYFSVAVLAAVLYPFAWYFMLGEEAMRLLYTDLVTATISTLSIVVGSVFGVAVALRIAQNAPTMFHGVIVRFGGAIIGAQVPTFAFLAILYVSYGMAPTFAGWWNFQGISMIPLFVTYWIVHLLVKKLAPSVF